MKGAGCDPHSDDLNQLLFHEAVVRYSHCNRALFGLGRLSCSHFPTSDETSVWVYRQPDVRSADFAWSNLAIEARGHDDFRERIEAARLPLDPSEGPS